MRKDTKTVLGIVGARYRVAQNTEALQFVDNLIGRACTLQTAGSLHAGRRVWALVKLPEDITVGGDVTEVFVLVTNSHDGSTAVQAVVTPIRVVCQNTLTWGLNRAKRMYSIRHTESLGNHLAEARRVLDLTVDYTTRFKAIGDRLALEPFTDRRLRTVLDELYPAGTEDVSPRARRSRHEAHDTIVEHLDWLRPTRGGRGPPGRRGALRPDDRRPGAEDPRDGARGRRLKPVVAGRGSRARRRQRQPHWEGRWVVTRRAVAVEPGSTLPHPFARVSRGPLRGRSAGRRHREISRHGEATAPLRSRSAAACGRC